jgi:hypothetical protein
MAKPSSFLVPRVEYTEKSFKRLICEQQNQQRKKFFELRQLMTPMVVIAILNFNLLLKNLLMTCPIKTFYLFHIDVSFAFASHHRYLKLNGYVVSS